MAVFGVAVLLFQIRPWSYRGGCHVAGRSIWPAVMRGWFLCFMGGRLVGHRVSRSGSFAPGVIAITGRGPVEIQGSNILCGRTRRSSCP